MQSPIAPPFHLATETRYQGACGAPGAPLTFRAFGLEGESQKGVVHLMVHFSLQYRAFALHLTPPGKALLWRDLS